MSAIDTYGEFEIPEEKSSIEVVENPVGVVRNCYELFKRATREMVTSNMPWGVLSGPEKVYSLAEQLFEGKEKIKINSEQLNHILLLGELISRRDGTELFLSALQNKTKTDVLALNPDKNEELFDFCFPGYKLKENKTLVVGPNGVHKVPLLGVGQKGNVIMCTGSQNFINTIFDTKLILETWFSSKNSPILKTINFSQDTGLILDEEVISLENYTEKLYFGYLRDHNTSAYRQFHITNDSQSGRLKIELEQKLKEIDFFNKRNLSREQIFDQIESYDWQGFSQKIREIAKQIKEECF